MKATRVTLEIERLVLDGLSATPSEAARIRAAAEAELSRLLSSGSLPPSLLAGGAQASRAAPPIDLAPRDSPELIGHRIAQSVHLSLGGRG